MNIKDIIREEIRVFNEGIQVWHGSDRKFDDFDMSKVGSGDGKNLGGWGIYFSDNENVSQRYYTSNGFVRPHEIRNGNYFDLDASMDDGDNIVTALQNLEVSENNIEEFQNDFIGYADDVTNKQVLDWLSYVLGGERQASMFLQNIGYIGNTFMDKWETDARNYVIFNTKSIIN